MALDGSALGGWSQYSLSPTDGAWVAHSFYLHWRYTLDRVFLSHRAYPYCEAIATSLEALLRPDERGRLKLPMSTSPEVYDNSLNAWLTPNSGYDLSLLRWLFGALGEMADVLDKDKAAAHWRGVLARLDDLATEGREGPLRLSPDLSLTFSHRHFSHLLAIYPLGTFNVEGTEREGKVVAASLKQLRNLGTSAWCGYSFSWMACLAARAGQAEEAARYLSIFVRAFVSPNGFHLNGDYKRLGYSGFTYRPFTLEGNFAAAQAVHEMLLQSWGGAVRVFPAMPERWADASFRDLRAEGAFRVSAERRAGTTVRVRIVADRGGLLRLRDPFANTGGSSAAAWSRPPERRSDGILEWRMRPGGSLEGTPRSGSSH
jgi:alpha-L-fucosidase 2